MFEMNLEKILNEHSEQTKQSSKKVLNELKSASNDYGSLKTKLALFKRHTIFKYGDRKKYEYLFFEVEQEIEKEINNIKLVKKDDSALEKD